MANTSARDGDGDMLRMQRQIRHNADELNQFVQEVYDWQDACNENDTGTGRPAPSSRSDKVVGRGGSAAPHTFDKGYAKLEKIDVNKALEDVDERERRSTTVPLCAEIPIRAPSATHFAEDIREKGNERFRTGKYHEAVGLYSQCVEINPLDLKALANRAAAYLNLKRYADAENDCSAVLAADKDNAKVLLRRGTARTSLKKMLSAIMDFEQVSAVCGPDHPSAKAAQQHIATIRSYLSKPKSKTPAQKFPRRRLVIEEVSGSSDDDDDCDGSEGSPAIATVSNAISSLKPDSIAAVVKSSSTVGALPPCPKTSYEFEHVFRSLHRDAGRLFSFLIQIPVALYPRLFCTVIDADVIMDCLLSIDSSNLPGALNILRGLSTVDRFGIMIMFFNDQQKMEVRDLFRRLYNADPSTAQDCAAIAKLYDIVL